MNYPAIATSGLAGSVARPEGNPMELDIDRERCIGAGMCALIAPEVFDQDEADGRVRLLDPGPPSSYHSTVREAAHSCPAAAIVLVPAGS